MANTKIVVLQSSNDTATVEQQNQLGYELKSAFVNTDGVFGVFEFHEIRWNELFRSNAYQHAYNLSIANPSVDTTLAAVVTILGELALGGSGDRTAFKQVFQDKMAQLVTELNTLGQPFTQTHLAEMNALITTYGLSL